MSMCQAADAVSKTLSQAPTQALGVSAVAVTNARDLASRDLLVKLCAFQSSSNPLESGNCLRSVPSTLTHDDAVAMCTNVSRSAASSGAANGMESFPAQCVHALPKDWTSRDAAVLCEACLSAGHVAAVMKCATVGVGVTVRLKRSDAATVCR